MNDSQLPDGSLPAKVVALPAFVGLLVLGIANGGGFTPLGIAQAVPAAVVIGGLIVRFL
ncbi:hypothetical protein [Halonotius roseus]|uniref:hypothetical protein n=1 Tax=Halonotius roseus TaxID=2511997 RepID=UPI00163C67D0|nr:hypothetical protein [Halonotius roseus]